MLQLASNKVNDDYLKSLWLNQLQKHSQTILAANSQPLDDLATMADKIHETFKFQNISSISQERSQTTTGEISVVSLAAKNNDIALEIQEFKTSRSRSENRKFSRAKFHSSKSRSEMCWCHRKLAKKATKCSKPCKFENSSAVEN
ncbi:hypothetical protein NPIL_425451 [Nephila pilipes]|uniref:Uncharacterized protein n=1 Tax=Nephila pilipes TaxID=299642 RepID=A0A8X6TH35_NEPPI|nr:hypothetical protein NPIL_425451 [Nephila pilipes]